MKLQLLPVFFFLALASCKQSSSSLSENERSLIIDSVKQTLQNYYSDIRREGLLAEFRYLDSSKDFFWAPPGYSHAISYDSVAKVLKQNAPGITYLSNSFDTLHIVPLSRELASYTGRLRSVMKVASGIEMTYTMIETGVMIKRADGWKLLCGQTAMLEK
jgi:hypothetical protein